MLDWGNGDISTRKLVLNCWAFIVETLFGVAYAAPIIDTTILYWTRSLSTVLSRTENSSSRTF